MPPFRPTTRNDLYAAAASSPKEDKGFIPEGIDAPLYARDHVVGSFINNSLNATRKIKRKAKQGKFIWGRKGYPRSGVHVWYKGIILQ